MRPEITCIACGERRPHSAGQMCSGCYKRSKRTGTVSAARHDYQPARTVEDWLALIDRTDPEVCWPWPGRLDRDGYGNVSGDVQRAHRLIWLHLVGPIGEDMTLDHACHNADISCPGGKTCQHRRCVNPGHLAEQTRGENSAARAGRIATCPAGHDYTEANTYQDPAGHRRCRECRRIDSVAQAAKRKAARHADYLAWLEARS